MLNKEQEIELLKTIDAFLRGNLSEAEEDDLWKSLLKHPEYLDYLETEAALRDLYQEKSDSGRGTEENKNLKQHLEQDQVSGKIPSESNAKINRMGAALAVAASITLIFAFLFLFNQPGQKTPGDLAINSIEISNMETSSIRRSETNKLTPADSLLNVGMQAAMTDNISKAERLYREVITKYDSEPAAAMAHLNLGIIQYNLGEYENAILSFRSAVEVPNTTMIVEEKAYWYMGNAYVNIEQWEKARSAVYEAYVQQGIFRDAAESLLDHIDARLSE